MIAVFGIWCEGRSVFHFRRSVVRNQKGRSYFFTQASQLVQSSQCLVFTTKGDRAAMSISNYLRSVAYGVISAGMTTCAPGSNITKLQCCMTIVLIHTIASIKYITINMKNHIVNCHFSIGEALCKNCF